MRIAEPITSYEMDTPTYLVVLLRDIIAATTLSYGAEVIAKISELETKNAPGIEDTLS